MNLSKSGLFMGRAACVAVVSLCFCGCGDKRSGSDSREESRAESGTENQARSEAAGNPLSAAVFKAKTSEVEMNGRKLVMGIIQANIERQGMADPVWPKASADKESGTGTDVDDWTFKSASDFFNALFDMGNYGRSEWSPAVEGGLLGTIGRNAVADKTIRAAGLDWCVAANLTDGTPDFMPVLVSANFNPGLLLRKWDGKANGTGKLPIGPTSGASKSMFGDQAVVIVRKSGAVQKIMKKDLTYAALYGKTGFDLSNLNPPLRYLTPTGVVDPVGHE